MIRRLGKVVLEKELQSSPRSMARGQPGISLPTDGASARRTVERFRALLVARAFLLDVVVSVVLTVGALGHLGVLDLSVPNTHPARSRSEPVLVDYAAEDFVPS